MCNNNAQFLHDLATVLNRHGWDVKLKTPDEFVARMLARHLEEVDKGTEPRYFASEELLSSTDALVWAKGFVDAFYRLPGNKVEVDWLHSWFASAMMAMHDHDPEKKRYRKALEDIAGILPHLRTSAILNTYTAGEVIGSDDKAPQTATEVSNISDVDAVRAMMNEDQGRNPHEGKLFEAGESQPAKPSKADRDAVERVLLGAIEKSIGTGNAINAVRAFTEFAAANRELSHFSIWGWEVKDAPPGEIGSPLLPKTRVQPTTATDQSRPSGSTATELNRKDAMQGELAALFERHGIPTPGPITYTRLAKMVQTWIENWSHGQ